MQKDYILFIDSGVGGLSTLSKVYKKMPANFLYYADNEHSPYGNHSANEIFEYLKNIINFLLKKYNIKLIVLACNTATTASIKRLRQHFCSIKFIGTEPALKLASNKGFKKILCASTPATLKQSRFIDLKNSIDATGAKTIEYAAKTLASSIEKHLLFGTLSTSYNLKKELFKLATKAIKCDSIVLGCTHYVLVKSQIQNITQKHVFDGNFGVLKQVLFASNTAIETCDKPTIKFFVSNNQISAKENYKKIFLEILAKV